MMRLVEKNGAVIEIHSNGGTGHLPNSEIVLETDSFADEESRFA